MASTLFFKTNQINQQLTQIYHPLCVSWNSTTKTWHYSLKNKRKLLPHLFISICVSGTIFNLLILIIILALILDPSLFSLNQIILELLIAGCLYPQVVLGELVLLFSGREVVAMANWGIPLLSALGLVSLPIEEDITLQMAFFKEISKLKSTQQNEKYTVDWFGLLASYIQMFILIFSFFISIILVYENNDPIYMVFKGMESPKLFGFPQVSDSILFKGFRYLATLYINQNNCVTAAYFVNVMLSIGQIIVKILVHINHVKLSYFNLNLYSEFLISVKLIHTMQKYMNGIYLSLVFFTLLLSINLSILGWSFLPFKAWIVAPILGITMLLCVMVTLQVGSLLFEITSNTLKNWKGQVNQVIKVKYMRRVLKSMRPISLPVADMGIIDREIKVNYFQGLMVYMVNTLIVLKDFL